MDSHFQQALYKSGQALDAYAFVGPVSIQILFLKRWISYNTFWCLLTFFSPFNSSVSLTLFLVILEFLSVVFKDDVCFARIGRW